MPRRSNQQADLSALLDNNPVYDLDNVYFSDQGWAYRHYKSADKLEFFDEILVAGEALLGNGDPDTTADAFGTASPTFLVGDGGQMPVDSVYVIQILTGGTTYADASGVATTGGSGTGLTVDITTSGGVVTDVNLATQGDGAYVDGETITITGGDAGATFEIAVL